MDGLDDIDRRILYFLADDARATSAPMIADEVGVSPGTIRNRITRLEAAGVIQGYHAAIDYERAEGALVTLFVCDVSVADRERLAKQALWVPGVVNVRELMTGRGNLHVTVVGSDTDDLAAIGRALSELDLDIVNEGLIQREYTRPYQSFGPDEERAERSMADFMSLGDDAEVVSVTVSSTAALAERTLADANDEGLLDENVLVIAIERENTILTPHGDTTIEPDDLVTVFSRGGVSDDLLSLFTADAMD